MKAPKLKSFEYMAILQDKKFVKIEYRSSYSSGKYVMKYSYYLKIQDKLNRLLKNCEIINMDFVYNPKLLTDFRGENYYG